MDLSSFLYDSQFKRKAQFSKYIYSKEAILTIVALVLFAIFFKTNTKYDALFYIVGLYYAAKKYQKTKLLYNSHLNTQEKSKNKVLLFSLLGKAREKVSKKHKKGTRA